MEENDNAQRTDGHRCARAVGVCFLSIERMNKSKEERPYGRSSVFLPYVY